MLQFSASEEITRIKNPGSCVFTLISVLLLSISSVAIAQAQERVLRKQVIVDASLNDVWAAFTTNQGAQTFFGRETKINPTLGGSYEVYFHPERPHGMRGCEEECHIQSIEPMKSLAFTWVAEPDTKTLHDSRITTIVFLDFKALSAHKTSVRFNDIGWGKGAEWDASYKAFERDWDVVLGRLKARFAKGPIDWASPPGRTESFSVGNSRKPNQSSLLTKKQ